MEQRLEDVLSTCVSQLTARFAVSGRRLTPNEIDAARVLIAQALRAANLIGRLDEARGLPLPPRVEDPTSVPPPPNTLPTHDTSPGFNPQALLRRKSTRPPRS